MIAVVDDAVGEVRVRRLWRDPKVLIGLCILVPLVLAAVFAPWLAPYDPKQLGGPSLAGPSGDHWLGTDFFGRDMLSRVLFGARTSVSAAAVVGVGVLAIGAPLGVLAGYVGGWVDTLIMRAVDIVLSLPWLLVALALATMLGFGFGTALVALVIVYTPQLVRVTRNSVLAVRDREYVLAARAIGESVPSVLGRYVVPNVVFPILVLLTSMMAYAILGEAAISYLGVGTQPPQTSWGLELSDNQQYINIAAHLTIFPGVAIALAVLSLNFIGDGIADHLGRIGQR
ncbi:MAG: ABC transporter permease [Actinobacteria bacterium]|nr:ABC transporter permease [Actinomycetota bacterium]